MIDLCDAWDPQEEPDSSPFIAFIMAAVILVIVIVVVVVLVDREVGIAT